MYDRHPKSDNEFRSTKQIYVCESCACCPHREKCYKGKYEKRIISVSQTFNRQKRKVKERINTLERIRLRMNRFI